MKTVISANIPVGLAERLKNKTKGTRSRVVARALKAYLDEKDAFDLSDVTTDSLMIELAFRKELTSAQKEMLRVIYKEIYQ